MADVRALPVRSLSGRDIIWRRPSTHRGLTVPRRVPQFGLGLVFLVLVCVIWLARPTVGAAGAGAAWGAAVCDHAIPGTQRETATNNPAATRILMIPDFMARAAVVSRHPGDPA